MKKFFAIFAILFFASCGKDPAPTPSPSPTPTPNPTPVPVPTPTPPPVVTFEVDGQKIVVKGQMKANPKVSLEEMRSAIRATVAQLEGVSVDSVKVVGP